MLTQWAAFISSHSTNLLFLSTILYHKHQEQILGMWKRNKDFIPLTDAILSLEHILSLY